MGQKILHLQKDVPYLFQERCLVSGIPVEPDISQPEIYLQFKRCEIEALTPQTRPKSRRFSRRFDTSEASAKSESNAGDGTTSAAVLTQATGFFGGVRFC